MSQRRPKKSLKEYFTLQGRFRNLKEEDFQRIEEKVKKEQDYLTRLAG